MNVSAKLSFSFTAPASARRRERSIRSILLRIRILGRFTSGSLARIASASSSMPLRASSRSATTSASLAPPQAELTIGALHLDHDPEHWSMIGAGLLDDAVGRRRQSPPLRPFLQRALGIAHGALRRVELVGESASDERLRRIISAIDENRADNRFAKVGEDRRIAALARCRLARPDLQMRADIPALRDLGAALAPHELGQPPGEFALGRCRKGHEQQLRNGKA